MAAGTIKSIFTKRYVIAVTLIAILTTGAFNILQLALKTSDSTALVVNMAGKQRMLSQRLASLSQQYVLSSIADPDAAVNTLVVRESLETTVREMRSANEALSSGTLNDHTRVELSKPMRRIYFGETDLKARVDAYLKSVERLIKEHGDTISDENLRMVLLQAERLLPDLNAAVQQYQMEGEANIKRIEELETYAWALTLLVLLLEIIFIFQPMSNKIQELFGALEKIRSDLEYQVQVRTLSLEQANMKLQHLASHDPLTGLKNRLNLERELEQLIEHYQRNHSPFGVLMLDIDWFKQINDTYGHDAGDHVLKEIASILSRTVREHDSVYRAGGEEFVILFNRIAFEQIVHKSEKIRKEVENYLFHYGKHDMKITVSGGIFHSDMPIVNGVQGIMKEADNALYEAKRAGRNRIVNLENV